MEEDKGRRAWNTVRWGRRKRVDVTMPEWGSFSIFVFLKKYRLYHHEEEEDTVLILSGMAPKFQDRNG